MQTTREKTVTNCQFKNRLGAGMQMLGIYCTDINEENMLLTVGSLSELLSQRCSKELPQVLNEVLCIADTFINLTLFTHTFHKQK